MTAGVRRLWRLGLLAAVAAPFVLSAATPRSGLAVSPTPPVTTGLQLWYEADTTSYNDGDPVMAWPDKSGLTRDLTSFNTGSAPIMRRNAVNGRAAIEFNGVNSLMKTYNSTFTIAQPDTFFIVYQSLDPNDSSRAFVFDSRNSSVRQVFGKSGQNLSRLYANGDFDIPGTGYPFGSFESWSGTFSGASSSVYRNGTLRAQGNAGGSSMDGFSVGSLSTSGPYGYDYSHFLVAEILAYSGSLSDTDRQAVTDWLNEKYNTSTPASPPANTAPPIVTGTARDNASLSASGGSWTGSNLSFSPQWQRCSGGTCTDILGATGFTYSVKSADVGFTLQVVVTASNTLGQASATSAQTVVIQASPPVNTGPPMITGTAREGSPLSASSGVWSGTPTITPTYQWQRCDGSGANCVDILNATGSDYTPTSADVGSTIRVVVTATNAGGAQSAPSQQTLPVVAASVTPPPDQPPVTSGLELWFDANAVQSADAQPVTRWMDESGHGRDLTSFDTNSAPAFRPSAVNGRAALEFNGSNSLMKTYGSTFTIAQPDTFFIVYKSLEAGGRDADVFDSSNSARRQLLTAHSPATTVMYADAPLAVATNYPFPNYQIWSGSYSGATSSLWKNGTMVASGAAGGSSLSGLAVGGLSTSGPYGYNFGHSLVAEILFYSGSLSDSDRQAVTDWLNQKYNVLAPLVAPSNTAAPTIGGTTTDGMTLTVSNGSWSGSTPFAFSYQWRRCDSSGTTCSDILGATNASYALTSGDIGSTIGANVAATNGAGSATAAAPATAAVIAAAPANTVAPALSGVAKEGMTLNASTGTWTGTTPIAYTYAWQRCDSAGANCQPIDSAASPTYLLTSGEVGSTIRVVVTGSNTAGNGAPATSSQTAAVAAASAPPPPGQPPVTQGLELWYDASTLTTGDSQPVSTWSDLSGHTRDLTAATSSASPVMRLNAVNGHAALEFNGSNSLMKTYGSTFTIAQPDTFFIVYKSLDQNPAGHEAYIWDSRNSSIRQLLGLGPFTNTEMYADADIEGPTTYPFPNYQIWGGTFQGNTSTLWKNGVKIATASAGGSALQGFTVGALSSGTQYGYLFSHSLVAEILFYSGSMNDTDRAAVTDWLNSKYNVLAPIAPPLNTALPTISGSAQDGATLSTTNGAWSGTTPLNFTYNWQRCDTTGSSCFVIPGAAASTYTLQPGDIGGTIRAMVTATNGAGSAAATAEQTPVVIASPPANTAAPTIGGTAQEGQTLNAANGTWTGTSPINYSYAWQRCDGAGANCAPLGVTTQSYVPVTADVGFTIRVVVSGSNGFGTVPATSAPTSAVLAASATPPPGSPPVTAGLELWFNANALTTADGQPVSTWADQSGHGRDLTSFATNSAPTMRRNAVNGLPALEFNGTRSLMKTYGSTFTISQPDTFFIVYKSLDSTEAYIWDSRNSAIRQLLGLGPLTNTEMYADTDIEAPTTYPFPNYQIWSGTFQGTTSTTWKNGAKIATADAGRSNMSGFTVGGLSTSGEYGYYFSHSIVAEILFYSGSMSDADRAAVFNWLNSKYATY